MTWIGFTSDCLPVEFSLVLKEAPDCIKRINMLFQVIVKKKCLYMLFPRKIAFFCSETPMLNSFFVAGFLGYSTIFLDGWFSAFIFWLVPKIHVLVFVRKNQYDLPCSYHPTLTWDHCLLHSSWLCPLFNFRHVST